MLLGVARPSGRGGGAGGAGGAPIFIRDSSGYSIEPSYAWMCVPSSIPTPLLHLVRDSHRQRFVALRIAKGGMEMEACVNSDERINWCLLLSNSIGNAL